MNAVLSYVAYVLDEAYDRLKEAYLRTSVLGPVRLYSAKDTTDREFWALFCALIDFQMPVVKVLNPMLIGLAGYVEERGLRFIDMIYDVDLASEILREFKWFSLGGLGKGFIHRFVRIHDVVNLLTALRRICEVHGSLRSFVEEL
jgi:hypothetical protein